MVIIIRIFIYDSGLGCLPLIKKMLIKNKKHDLYVFMDHDYFPLGEKSFETIQTRMKEIVRKVNFWNADLFIIACNTASTVIDDDIRKNCHCPIIDIFSCTKSLLKPHRLLIATKRTRNEVKYYHRPVYSVNKLIEAIEHHNLKECRDYIVKHRSKWKDKEIILGCTHLSLIDFMFKDYIVYDPYDIIIDKINDGKSFSIKGNEYAMKQIKQHFKHTTDT